MRKNASTCLETKKFQENQSNGMAGTPRVIPSCSVESLREEIPARVCKRSEYWHAGSIRGDDVFI